MTPDVKNSGEGLFQNLFDPRTYARNLSTPGGRVILRQQMSELFQTASVLAGTYALARAAGADVSLNPNDKDFLKIKVGNRRFDPGAGTIQIMRLIYRTGADLAKGSRSEKAARDESAADVGLRFLRSKLGPVPSFFVDWVTRQTFTGKPFSAAEGVRDRALINGERKPSAWAGAILLLWTLPNAWILHETWKVVSRMRMPMKYMKYMKRVG